MRRGVNGTDALDTINAAATAIASAENRAPHASAQKRRWGSCWSFYWCFGSHKNKRIGHAVLVPETTATSSDAPTADHQPQQPPSIVLPFVAPPSSPASFLPSEPPSATQSPTGLLSLTSVSANMYSPGGPASIFAIGPYAHELQLVSPPVFSTFTTEPSTAPYTPPPESVHLTTPSSPEVPFARLLEPYVQNGQKYPPSQYEFLSYQLQPGSPVSHLISPCSGISGSGTSSPFLDREFAARHPFFLQFQNGDKIMAREWESCQGSGVVTPDAVGPRSQLNRQISDVAPLPDMGNTRSRNDESVVDHRVSFEITAEEVIRCVEKKPVVLAKSVEEKPIEMTNLTSNDTSEKALADVDNEQRHQKNRTITLGSAKEFNFNNIEGGSPDEASIIGSSDWWVNEKVVGEDSGPRDWSFFPMMQTGVS
ncbi:hypothetical protein BUALT_Bualt05G0053400 [Buddleja alternifolia]|uniref:Hydroxyproline-rich glycoprotein family protein n=1 Tax=Buddleja alternifolia TaxID=168488 RepID=A0AAV6XGW8_9LAMI|nr:hypothetical protein BUALT_Bualt05G0053400 [Buddleja alternifolia]